VKVRIAVGLGTSTPVVDQGRFGEVVDALEDLRFDSLWLSERMGSVAPEPLSALAWAAGRTSRLKLGMSVLVVPGRNPVLLAKELATVDRLSGGRLLPAVGLGAADPREHQAFGVRREERAAWFDEALPLIRRLWTGEPVDHHGPRFHLDGVAVGPTPVQDPLEVWLGGLAPSELRRVGRLGDGWLPSFCTPDDAAERRPTVEEAAAGAGREIDPEHWGALVVYATEGLPDRLAAAVARRRPDLDPASLVPSSVEALRETCEAFVARGFSKLVVLPASEPADWPAELTRLAGALLPLQT
jgi:probable F420-dependent oxidoreductase